MTYWLLLLLMLLLRHLLLALLLRHLLLSLTLRRHVLLLRRVLQRRVGIDREHDDASYRYIAVYGRW